MKFGVKLANIGHFPLVDGVGRVAVAAEKAGYDSVWAADHVVVPQDFALDDSHKGASSIAEDQHADTFVCLAYIAGMTSRIELGTSILVLPFRNPLVTAKMISTLDALSGGRVVIGAGAGWLDSEFRVLNSPPYEKRGEVADEWIRIFKTCWNDSDPQFQGKHYSFGPLHFSPKPVRNVPVLVGGNSAPALRRAGRIGDGWHGSRATLDEIPAAIRLIKETAEKAGRDPSKLIFGNGVEVDIIKSDAERGKAGMFSPHLALVGTVAEICDKIGAFRDAGMHHLELRFRLLRDHSTSSISGLLDVMDQFASDIMPKFKTAR